MFVSNSEKYDLNLIKPYLLSIPVNEPDIEPTVTKNANQFISFKSFHNQLLDMLNFLGGPTGLDLLLKLYKSLKTQGSFPYKKFGRPDRKQKLELFLYDVFYIELRIFLHRNTVTLLIHWKMGWPQNKPLPNWNYQSHH